jgi:DNA-binding NarL/FixJ family response regulator
MEGRGWLARAEAEWRRAQGDNAPAAWATVLDEFGPGFVYEAARTRWRLAEALAETGHREQAQEEWSRAAEAASRLGAAPLRATLDDLALRARLTGSTERHGTGLTSREREVLRLIAEGRSNREIGQALFITPKTASVHVSNILAKLGVTSRTEAAAVAHREGIS